MVMEMSAACRAHYTVVRGKKHVKDQIQVGSIEEVGNFKLGNMRGTGQQKGIS